MFLNMLDKFLFGTFLLLTLQVPILADHYFQFISGYFESTKTQVEGYEATAAEHQFADVKAMIDNHLVNPEASVRTDAKQKLTTLQTFEDLKSAIAIFNEGNIFKKSVYMFKPSNWHLLKKVLPNFKPSIPLAIEYFIYAFVIALLLSAAIISLIRAVLKKESLKKKVA